MPQDAHTDALSLAQRQRHASLTHLLQRAVCAITDTDDGFGLCFPKRESTLVILAEWINLERHASADLDFALDLRASEDSVHLRISGQAAAVAALRRWLLETGVDSSP